MNLPKFQLDETQHVHFLIRPRKKNYASGYFWYL